MVLDEGAFGIDLPWRVGRKVGRTIYAVVSDDTSDDDVLIGVMDTRELAHTAVVQHNLAVTLIKDARPLLGRADG